MTRAWRIEYEGALYHVLSKGNDRRNIVVDDTDRNLFLDTAGEMSQRFEIDICAKGGQSFTIGYIGSRYADLSAVAVGSPLTPIATGPRVYSTE